MKGKKLNLVGRIFLSAVFAIGGFVNNANAAIGNLEIINFLSNSNYKNCLQTVIHRPGASEGLDSHDEDYNPQWGEYTKSSKIISKIPDYELEKDSRSTDSITPINLELSIHKQYAEKGDPVTISSGNELRCSLPLAQSYGYDFGTKPITYWERDDTEPNLYHMKSNVRKEIWQNGGVIPLDNLDGTYGSEEPYLYPQIRFDTYFVHLNDDDTVDGYDYAIFANAFSRTGITDADRANPADLGAQADYDLDGDVDLGDLRIFIDYYLTGKEYGFE